MSEETMKKRLTPDNGYPDDIQSEVESACRENREISLSEDQLEKLGHGPKPLSKVIRAFCLDCMGGNSAEVRRCTSVGCSHWPYRKGRNVFTKRLGNVAHLRGDSDD